MVRRPTRKDQSVLVSSCLVDVSRLRHPHACPIEIGPASQCQSDVVENVKHNNLDSSEC